MKDLYEILGVSRNATQEEIKRAYRKIAMKYHPDRNPGDKDAEQKFKEAAEAYAILNDQEKRARYDQFGHAGVGMGEAEGTGFGGFRMSMDDIFSQFGDIFGGRNPFEDIFGGRTTQRRTVRKARDLRITLELEPLEILQGVEKRINIKRYETCDTCDGTGARPGTRPTRCHQCGGSGQVRQISRTFFGQSVVVTDCPVCHGEGEVVEHPCRDCGGHGITKKKVSIKIKVPPGVASGNYMTLEGQGNKGGKGVYPGDLVVFFEEKEHPFFTRQGRDVFVEVHITVAQAVLGATVEIPTIEGRASLKIPAGIQPGQILRMRGKGYPRLRGGQRGDQLVKVQVDIPKSLSRRERELFHELEKMSKNSKPYYRKIEL
jgi:molecular chaperone DnaJ